MVRESDALSSSRKARSAFRTTWARPGFLFPSTGRAGAFRPSFDHCRGLSRRFNSRWSRALSPSGERESNPFAVVVPECRTRGRCPRATGARLLVAPAVLGVCEGGNKSRDGPRGKTGCHTVNVNEDGCFFPLPTARSGCARGRGLGALRRSRRTRRGRGSGGGGPRAGRTRRRSTGGFISPAVPARLWPKATPSSTPSSAASRR